ncbi:maleylpyruvate isomerase N-terminal domain-containing protein [Kitasatospora sp. NPDC006697]|uniref:maleylpyruvate isomerase N-terminal domain-containing protein n=1 Tax=Kitasatospora sp. NPDC006697 TaxID=3364020 RepID=UPI00368EA48A
MDQHRILPALRAEAEALTRALTGLDGTDWELPTRCAPWTVRELLGHIRVALARVPGMLDAPEPAEPAEVTAAGYYRPDDRFSSSGNAARIDLARDLAAEHTDGAALLRDFAATWQELDRRCRPEPATRAVRTRHGDAMPLPEFLLTRVVEVAVHGLDLADALGREPWLTDAAEAVLLDLLVGPEQVGAVRELDWGGADFLRKATGRAELTAAEAAEVERLGLRWLTLG